jgi:hypothetical protein
MNDVTRAAFKRFNKQNPTVYRKFKKYANQMHTNGRRRYSAWAIINAIRWEEDFKTRGSKFKINNDFIALYARKLVKANPKFKTFFNLKQLK